MKPSAPRNVVVFAAAPLQPTPRLRSRLAAVLAPFVIAADGGTETALTFGYQPDVVIGDLDSLCEDTLVEVRRRGVAIETYPRAKDATDGQLAIERALQVPPAWLLLVGFLGGLRLDQALANVLLVARIDAPVTLIDAYNEATLVRSGGELAWRPEPAEVVSLLPLDGDAEGVRTAGLRWPLHGERLRFGDTRGVSNEPVSFAAARVALDRGTLLVTRHFPGG